MHCRSAVYPWDIFRGLFSNKNCLKESTVIPLSILLRMIFITNCNAIFCQLFCLDFTFLFTINLLHTRFYCHQPFTALNSLHCADVLQSLVVAVVLSRFDCGSTVLIALPQQQIDKLRSVQDAAARLVLAACRRYHISPLLCTVFISCVLLNGCWCLLTNVLVMQHLTTCQSSCSEFPMSVLQFLIDHWTNHATIGGRPQSVTVCQKRLLTN